MVGIHTLTGRMLCAALLLSSSAALAEEACPSGRAADGKCLNPSLFGDARETAMIFSQPKISSTHYPILPSGDWSYRYPNQLTSGPQQASPSGVPVR